MLKVGTSNCSTLSSMYLPHGREVVQILHNVRVALEALPHSVQQLIKIKYIKKALQIQIKKTPRVSRN